MHRGVDYIQPGPKEVDVKITQYLIRQERNVAKQTKKATVANFHAESTKLTQLQKGKRLFKPTDPTFFFLFTVLSIQQGATGVLV